MTVTGHISSIELYESGAKSVHVHVDAGAEVPAIGADVELTLAESGGVTSTPANDPAAKPAQE